MHYAAPPRQSRRGQMVDALFIVLLLFVTLFVTTFMMQLEESDTESGTSASEIVPLSDLPINDTEREQFQKMIDSGMTDLETVNQSVAASEPRDDKYEISVAALLGTLALLVGYLTFVYRTSFREYREVVEYKFGPRYEEVES
ncbi:MAG: hypothetical protein GEU86_21735 [Actinophytocola sp.]|nr:hypothetical protein [Actinophytocola sp.]